jgi:hypothetical protein
MRDTVLIETPASLATSRTVGGDIRAFIPTTFVKCAARARHVDRADSQGCARADFYVDFAI